MKIPRIKLPDKNLISLREFISGWRVNYHSAGLGRFKLNLGKTTTFPRSTLRHICQIHSRWKTKKASRREICSLSRLWLSDCGWWVMFTGGDTEIWLLFSLATRTRDIDGRRALSWQPGLAWWCQLAFSPAPHLSLASPSREWGPETNRPADGS